MEMGSGVAIGRSVTAVDSAACLAHAQVHPGVAPVEALLTDVHLRRNEGEGRNVATGALEEGQGE